MSDSMRIHENENLLAPKVEETHIDVEWPHKEDLRVDV